MGSKRGVTSAILLSGGIDSIALAWWTRPDVALTVDYGHVSAAGEIRAASTVCRRLGLQHEILEVDCSSLGSGDLSGRPPLDIAPVSEWWPFRNQLLVTLAGIRSLSLGVEKLLVASVSSDGQHVDGTAEFYRALDQLMQLQEGRLRLEAPALSLTSAELVRRSGVPRDVLAWAHSCHMSDFACGTCRGCCKHSVVTKELWGASY